MWGLLLVLKQRKWNYASLKSLSRRGNFFHAGRMASLVSLKTFKYFQKCIISLPIHQHKQWCPTNRSRLSSILHPFHYLLWVSVLHTAIWMAAEGIKVAGEWEVWFWLRHIQNHFKPFWGIDRMTQDCEGDLWLLLAQVTQGISKCFSNLFSNFWGLCMLCSNALLR